MNYDPSVLRLLIFDFLESSQLWGFFQQRNKFRELFYNKTKYNWNFKQFPINHINNYKIQNISDFITLKNQYTNEVIGNPNDSALSLALQTVEKKVRNLEKRKVKNQRFFSLCVA